ncbi:hypothetical protein ANN_13582 [Periplaneta americana]|uniref:Reverse transcriptase domain-containing protein n=1 Tax=Periplaneta americana TaxID=6978 RepID=A0ABQ8TMD9_PERAM|nr:hypothetical protein ANN_13582 [Periplaneta americana]
MSPGSSTESYPAFARIGLRENPGKNLNQALSNQGVEHKYINILTKLYGDSHATVMTEREGQTFRIERGVRQGDPISPKLFTSLLEDIFRKLKWKKRHGININGHRLTNLRFADDIVLFAKNATDLQEMIQELSDCSAHAGLSMNMEKPKSRRTANHNQSKSTHPDYITNHNPRSEELTGTRQIHVETELPHLFRIPRIPSSTYSNSVVFGQNIITPKWPFPAIYTYRTDSYGVAAVKSLPSEQLLEDILFIDSNFKIVSKSIILLESSKLQLSEALYIVDKVSQIVIQINNSLISEKVKCKLRNIIAKNSAYSQLRIINNVPSGHDKTSEVGVLKRSDFPFFKYIPLQFGPMMISNRNTVVSVKNYVVSVKCVVSVKKYVVSVKCAVAARIRKDKKILKATRNSLVGLGLKFIMPCRQGKVFLAVDGSYCFSVEDINLLNVVKLFPNVKRSDRLPVKTQNESCSDSYDALVQYHIREGDGNVIKVITGRDEDEMAGVDMHIERGFAISQCRRSREDSVVCCSMTRQVKTARRDAVNSERFPVLSHCDYMSDLAHVTVIFGTGRCWSWRLLFPVRCVEFLAFWLDVQYFHVSIVRIAGKRVTLLVEWNFVINSKRDGFGVEIWIPSELQERCHQLPSSVDRNVARFGRRNRE